MSNASDDSKEVREPLVEKDMAESKQEQPWMVYLSTFVAVCGSFAFGSCVREFTYPWKLTKLCYAIDFFFFIENGF